MTWTFKFILRMLRKLSPYGIYCRSWTDLLIWQIVIQNQMTCLWSLTLFCFSAFLGESILTVESDNTGARRRICLHLHLLRVHLDATQIRSSEVKPCQSFPMFWNLTQNDSYTNKEMKTCGIFLCLTSFNCILIGYISKFRVFASHICQIQSQ